MKRIFGINWRNLKSRFMMMIIIIIILMLSVLTIVYFYSSKVITNRIEEHFKSSASIASNYVAYRLDKSKGIARVIANNANLDRIRRLAILDTRPAQEYSDALTGFSRDIMYHTEVNMEIHSIFVYFEEEELFFDANRNIFSEDQISDIIWMNTARYTNAVTWMELNDEVLTNTKLISMVYRADRLSIRIQSPVYVFINFEVEEFHSFLQNIAITENARCALINTRDKLLIFDADSMERADVRVNTLGRNIEDLMNPKLEVWIDITDQGKALLKLYELELIEGGLLHIIPQQDLRPFNRSIFILIIGITAFLFLLYILLFHTVINRFIDKPVQKLVHHMKKVEQGDFSSRITEQRKDEFGYVYAAYNEMVLKVESLIHELYQEKLVKKEMELKVLQEKINPHFLYNTLDTINWLARQNNVQEISRMVIDLSTLYRLTFNKGRDLISIRDILSSIRCYLDIQQIRYGESFRYEILADESLMDVQVLNLIIQTIVENAVIHGFSPQQEEGLLSVSIIKEDGNLRIAIRDNGKGMSPEKLELITAIVDSEIHENASGLRNVQKRIKLYYGEAYGIRIHSVESQGTEVIVSIPIKEKDNEGMEDF